MALAEQSDNPMVTVLTVDDETDNAELVKRCLEKRTDVTVVVACSASQALTLLQTRAVDVMFVDHRMPEMTGIELVESAQGLARAPAAIMLTGYPDDPAVVGAQRRGLLQCVIAKPWKLDEVLLALGLALKMRQLR